MTDLPLYQFDAFSDRLFAGNPAAVCPLPGDWLPAEEMQAIAAENNLAETAFLVRKGEDWAIRWFTPAVEVDLCGHATLAVRSGEFDPPSCPTTMVVMPWLTAASAPGSSNRP